jgi:hypothetical protein
MTVMCKYLDGADQLDMPTQGGRELEVAALLVMLDIDSVGEFQPKALVCTTQDLQAVPVVRELVLMAAMAAVLELEVGVPAVADLPQKKVEMAETEK